MSLSHQFILEKYKTFIDHYPKYKPAVNLNYLPFQKFRIYEDWLPPKGVNVLFLAESPSWIPTTYFYSDKCKTGLSREIPKYLKLKGETKEKQLDEFKSKGFFLVDTIKCIWDKNVERELPIELIEFSANEILQQEIKNLKPKCIFALGTTALYGLKSIQEFSNALSEINNITKANGKIIKSKNTNIILSPFLSYQTIRFKENIESAFKLVFEEY